jgi:UDP-glucose 4-epimerase
VLVIGGAGYIGCHAAHALHRHGYNVLIYDNLSRGHRFLTEGFDLIEADIADRSQLTRALERVAGVMHFAADSQVGESVEKPRKYFSNNVEGGLTLLNAALDAGVRKFIFSSTCAVYGIPAKVPITEDTPRQPVNPYGMSKLFFENALEAYGRAYGLRSVSLRYFNAAGADESGSIGEVHDPETHLIPCALKAITGERGALELFGNTITDSARYNLGTGEGASVQDVIATIEEVTGSTVPRRMGPRRPGDPPELVADPSRAQAALGWKATRSLRDIVRTAWHWEQKVRQHEQGRLGMSPVFKVNS